MKDIVKKYLWIIACDIVCLLTGIVLIVTSIATQETVIGIIFISLSCIGAHWIGFYEGKEIARKRIEQAQHPNGNE